MQVAVEVGALIQVQRAGCIGRVIGGKGFVVFKQGYYGGRVYLAAFGFLSQGLFLCVDRVLKPLVFGVAG